MCQCVLASGAPLELQGLAADLHCHDLGQLFFGFDLVLADADLDPLRVKVEDDPRLTRVGRFLRRWSLDELPQFWSVLKGEMNLNSIMIPAMAPCA